jgi:hypothetical protein
MPTLGPPPTIENNDGIVTIHADLAWMDGYLPEGAKTISGTVLGGGSPSLRASVDGVSPIVLQLPPGTYSIDAYGYPIDRMDPLRAFETFEVVITAPDRIQQLARMLTEFSQRLYQFENIKRDIALFNPTREELKQVLE